MFRIMAKKAWLVAAGSYGTYQVKKKYAPERGIEYKVGQVVNEEGDVFVGYFGAHEETVENLDTTRPTFYDCARKTTPQEHALARGGWEKARVAVLVAKRTPEEKDHLDPVGPNKQWYKPMSPQYMREAKLRVYEVERVTPKNRRGVIGYVRRVYLDVKDKLSKTL